jgi:hypothetical protein
MHAEAAAMERHYGLGVHFGNVLSSGSRRSGRAGRCAAPDDSRALTGVVIYRLFFNRSCLPCEGSRIRSTSTVRGYLWVYGRVRRLIRHGCALGARGACEASGRLFAGDPPDPNRVGRRRRRRRRGRRGRRRSPRREMTQHRRVADGRVHVRWDVSTAVARCGDRHRQAAPVPSGAAVGRVAGL